MELIDEHEDDQDETNDSDPNETTDQSSEDEPQTEEVCEFYCILSKMNSSGWTKEIFFIGSKLKVDSSLSDDCYDEERDDIDDIIILNGCGQTTKWRFPMNSEECPLITCRIPFKNRLDGINHYRAHHAIGSILCSICDKPIRVASKKDFTIHYERKHVNQPVPFNFDEKMDKVWIVYKPKSI